MTTPDVAAVLRSRLLEQTSRGLADAVSTAIRDGMLPEGQRLPPIREVAAELALSPTTVSAAWNVLARAGTIRTDGRRGTTVSLPAAGPTRYRRALDRDAAQDRGALTLDLSTGVPDPALLPALPRSLPHLSRARARASYLDEPALPELVEVVSDGWPYRPDAFTVVDGAMDALQQIVTGVVGYGSQVLVEHPCFPPFLDLLESVGSRIVGVPVDDEGLVPDELARRAAGADLLLLQPRAQNPTGVSMTRSRAEALAAIVRRHSQLLVVEDDSAGPIATSPVVSLARWVPERTLHIRSYSKSHGPDLRIAVVSGPGDQIRAVNERRYLGQGWTSQIIQGLLHHYLTDEKTMQTVEAARREYARRRESLQSALSVRGIPTVAGDGLNLWLPVRDEVAALVRLAGRGIGAAAGTPFIILPDAEPHLRVTAGLVADRHDDVAAELAAASALPGWVSAR